MSTVISHPALLRTKPRTYTVTSPQSLYKLRVDAIEQNLNEIRFKVLSPSLSSILDGGKVLIRIPVTYTYSAQVRQESDRVGLESSISILL